MTKNTPKTYNSDDTNNSAILHEFFTLYREFHESMSRSCADKLIAFLENETKSKHFIEHARFNPHIELHVSIETDVEATITALKSWINDKVQIEVPIKFLKDLKFWITKE